MWRIEDVPGVTGVVFVGVSEFLVLDYFVLDMIGFILLVISVTLTTGGS